jgi:hypothetical protein
MIVWKPGRKRALKETMQVCENNTSIALLRTGVVPSCMRPMSREPSVKPSRNRNHSIVHFCASMIPTTFDLQPWIQAGKHE